jgi:hypothetical protein
MTQQFDVYGQPLAGGQLFIIQAGTVATLQNPYQDAGLTLLLPNPITLDAAGRIPQFFLADGYIKVRLQDVHGVTQLAQDGILVIGPSAGGGGGGAAIDPTSVMQTGDMKFRHDTAIVSGFVRLNGKTIGSAASGATELADPSAQALFNYLWTKDAALAVTPSRGASSAADWAANKQIAVPDWRGYAPGGLDGMGSTLAGRLTSSYFGAANADVLGAVGGVENFTLAATHIPASGLSVSGNTGTESANHTHAYNAPGANFGVGSQAIALTATLPAVAANTGIESALHTHGFSASVAGGGGQPLRTIGPRKLITFYMKL